MDVGEVLLVYYLPHSVNERTNDAHEELHEHDHKDVLVGGVLELGELGAGVHGVLHDFSLMACEYHYAIYVLCIP